MCLSQYISTQDIVFDDCAPLLQFILEPLWKAYEALEAGADVMGILGKIVKGLGLSQACS